MRDARRWVVRSCGAAHPWHDVVCALERGVVQRGGEGVLPTCAVGEGGEGWALDCAGIEQAPGIRSGRALAASFLSKFRVWTGRATWRSEGLDGMGWNCFGGVGWYTGREDMG
jgi:hypothetical protein